MSSSGRTATRRRETALSKRARSLLRPTSATSPVDQLATRFLALVRVDRPTERERRLVSLAEQIAVADGRTRDILGSHLRIYVALACCSWATDGSLDERSRSAAFAAAIALGAIASQNLREVMGLDEKLRAAADASHERSLVELARRAASREFTGELDVYRSLEPIVRDMEDVSGDFNAARSIG